MQQKMEINGIRIFFEGRGDNVRISGEVGLEYSHGQVTFGKIKLIAEEAGGRKIKLVAEKNGFTIKYRELEHNSSILLKFRQDSKIELALPDTNLVNGKISKDEVKRLVNKILSEIMQLPMNLKAPNEVIIKSLFEYATKMTDNISSFLVFLHIIN